MPPKTEDAPFATQEEMAKFVADARKTMEDARTQGEKLRALDTLVPQLQAGIDAMQLKMAEAAVHVPHGTDAEVVRSYAVSSANRDEVVGGVVDLRKSGNEMGRVTESNRWVGSADGVVRMLGGIEDGDWEYGLLDDPRPKSEWQHQLQEKSTKLGIALAFAKAKAGGGDPGGFSVVRALKRGFMKHLKRGPASIAKMFAGNSGEGGEFIQTLPLTMIERTAEMPRIIEGQIPDLPMSAGTVKLPFLIAGAQPFVHGKPLAGDLNAAMLPKAVPSTTERTLTVPTLAVNIPVELDAIEDMTITDGLGILVSLLGEAMIAGREDALFNGDDSSPHQDTGLAVWNPDSRWQVLGSPADHRTAYKGWRKRAFAASAAADGSANQDIAHYIAAKANMTSPHGVLDVFYATSPQHYLAKVITDSNVLTVDKFGLGATIHTGQVASIGGSPLFLSQFMTADQNASGLFDNATTTYTSLVIVGRNRYRMGRRRSMRVNVEIVYREGVAYLVASERAGLLTVDGSTVKNVYLLYKLAKT